MPTADHLLKQLGYDTLGTIGEGAYSNVKMATSRNHQRTVAIKVIDKKKVSADYARKFLPRELAILRKVKHPTVITAFEIIEISNYPQFIVTELCVSDLMQFVLNAVRLSAEMARHLFRQIARGLRYLHNHHMAHRDLKCENVLITSDINAKISDLSFGIMFDGNSSSVCTTYCGSPQYASPEFNACNQGKHRLQVIVPFHKTFECLYEFIQRSIWKCAIQPLNFPTGLWMVRSMEGYSGSKHCQNLLIHMRRKGQTLVTFYNFWNTISAYDFHHQFLYCSFCSHVGNGECFRPAGEYVNNHRTIFIPSRLRPRDDVHCYEQTFGWFRTQV
ncbi:unnamed protein product [Ranitomeya imitator]|uniref:non-specific serine/threonine protein kinase n=1 Tax=Ranitomeya imitator TaxID=111125 RepID=A0ABN9LL81_9NEOB|nr:unnamed protein product [Ranitomeya imitator]